MPDIRFPDFSDAHAAIARMLEAVGPVLALDIGSGTQDVLLAVPGERPENWPRFVLPAPSRQVAERIRQCATAKRPVWLHGRNMGGGFGAAVREHVQAGLAVSATLAASRALSDDSTRVVGMGVTLSETCPATAVAVSLADYEAGFWRALLSAAGLPLPSLVVAAVQDHGVHPDIGNRGGRFQLWKRLLAESQGAPSRWLFEAPPASFTRLDTLRQATGGPVADTGTAAVLAALVAPEVRDRAMRQGVTVVNMGNSHILAFLLFRDRVYGVYEQHTGLRDITGLLHDLREFKLGWLPDEVVREQGGHGSVFTGDLPPEAEGFAPTFILGPQREQLAGHGQCFAPHGDMMLAGCHGLLCGLAVR